MSKPWYRQPKLCLVGSPAFALLAEATPRGPPVQEEPSSSPEKEQEVWANLLLLSSHVGRRFATSFEMQASHVYVEV